MFLKPGLPAVFYN